MAGGAGTKGAEETALGNACHPVISFVQLGAHRVTPRWPQRAQRKRSRITSLDAFSPHFG